MPWRHDTQLIRERPTYWRPREPIDAYVTEIATASPTKPEKR